MRPLKTSRNPQNHPDFHAMQSMNTSHAMISLYISHPFENPEQIEENPAHIYQFPYPIGLDFFAPVQRFPRFHSARRYYQSTTYQAVGHHTESRGIPRLFVVSPSWCPHECAKDPENHHRHHRAGRRRHQQRTPRARQASSHAPACPSTILGRYRNNWSPIRAR